MATKQLSLTNLLKDNPQFADITFQSNPTGINILYKDGVKRFISETWDDEIHSQAKAPAHIAKELADLIEADKPKLKPELLQSDELTMPENLELFPEVNIRGGRRLSLTKLWNNSLILSEKDPEPRDYARASELGKPLIDRFLTMQGVKQSNPPNERSRRKFFSGNVWEFIAGLVLNQMGVVQSQQTTIVDESMPIKVIGHLDYLIGGIPNYDNARKILSNLAFDEAMTARFMRVIDNFENEYGYKPIEQCVHEIKSCSEYVLEKIQDGGSVQGHDLQIGHYVRGLKLDYGIITYISKNDALMAEKVIRKTPESESLLRKDLAQLKGYLDANQRPPSAPLITFEGKFNKNFGVEYSSYLTLIYGFETPEDYRNSVQSKIASWNRLLKRLQYISEGKTTPTGKPITLTPKNQIAIDEIAKEGFGDANALAKQARINDDEEETTD